MTLANNKRLNVVLWSLEGVGAVFVVMYLAAYLGGIPTTSTLQSQPAFRIPLTILGVILLVLILATVVLAAISRPKRQSS
jgi:uncharacterized membrane protein